MSRLLSSLGLRARDDAIHAMLTTGITMVFLDATLVTFSLGFLWTLRRSEIPIHLSFPITLAKGLRHSCHIRTWPSQILVSFVLSTESSFGFRIISRVVVSANQHPRDCIIAGRLCLCYLPCSRPLYHIHVRLVRAVFVVYHEMNIEEIKNKSLYSVIDNTRLRLG